MVTIIGIKMNHRLENAVEFQSILTKHGCSIKTRIGLHNSEPKSCAPYGIILLEIVDSEKALEIEKELLEISDIELQRMIFD